MGIWKEICVFPQSFLESVYDTRWYEKESCYNILHYDRERFQKYQRKYEENYGDIRETFNYYFGLITDEFTTKNFPKTAAAFPETTSQDIVVMYFSGMTTKEIAKKLKSRSDVVSKVIRKAEREFATIVSLRQLEKGLAAIKRDRKLNLIDTIEKQDRLMNMKLSDFFAEKGKEFEFVSFTINNGVLIDNGIANGKIKEIKYVKDLIDLTPSEFEKAFFEHHFSCSINIKNQLKQTIEKVSAALSSEGLSLRNKGMSCHEIFVAICELNLKGENGGEYLLNDKILKVKKTSYDSCLVSVLNDDGSLLVDLGEITIENLVYDLKKIERKYTVRTFDAL